MHVLNKIIAHIAARSSLYFFVVLAIFSIDRHHRWEFSKDEAYGPFYSDVQEYYSFLPDILLGNEQSAEANFKNNKRTVGMALMYAPSFFVADIIANANGQPRTGYSKPYQWSIRWGSIIYVFLGLLFCRLNLRMFFSETITTISLACLFFGTNLFFYTYSTGEMPHSYLFFLYSAFVYFCLRWFREKKNKQLFLFCIIAGMITLIRPTDIIVLLFPLLYKVTSFRTFKSRLKDLLARPRTLLVALLLFCLPLLLQSVLWKIYVGSFVYYSYGEERFFFADPQIFNFLLSYRKGWLIYTPIMLFALIGLVMAVKRFKDLALFLILFTILNVYVLSSWWEWSYGGSFGCRAMIQSYAFLVFAFAVFCEWFWNAPSSKVLKYLIRTALLAVFYCLVWFNLFQSDQYKNLVIHWSGMNKEVYWKIFLRDDLSAEELRALRYTPPDAGKMIKGDRDH
jgi:4-amino-4-deoxy-L-arabinose transferase-like glycosyltransferase